MRKVASKNVFDTANVHAFRLEYCTPCTAECCRAYLCNKQIFLVLALILFRYFFSLMQILGPAVALHPVAIVSDDAAARWGKPPPPLQPRIHLTFDSCHHRRQSQRAMENILALSSFCSAADFFQFQFLVCSFFFFYSLIYDYTFVFCSFVLVSFVLCF